MTEKRFTTVELPKPNKWGIWYDGAYLSTYQVCILLNEQLKFKLEEVRSDEKQLGISFMEFKMKLIEKLQIHYDYATEQKQKNLNDIFVAKAYDIIRYDIKKLAEEMGVDFE